ncbi:porin [Arthrospiribacter ruber]|uniref:Porin n=1 Tax=Arthrospiribacter ruber TaxID=2487934 RepID=A0A951J015_9BACT|nr:porin [Arthrospiribacter ruber]MBW3469519.1 porin [Arthrospiribacter ruber]
MNSSKSLTTNTFISLVCLMSVLSGVVAQQLPPTQIPYFQYSKGLEMTAPDSLFQMNIRFRMQNRFAFYSPFYEDGVGLDQIEARVRRLRLRLDGFIYSPKLTYVIQLSFTRGDMDYDVTQFPNIIRDAMVIYQFNEKFSMGLGQTKLPGNRQRVNSSGDLQLPDRSIVNAAFNIDRDFGIQAYYVENRFVLRGALSTGEGRNILSTDPGLAYTVRGEVLPFGHFSNGGDYFEGDLMREKSPKVSLGITYSYNNNTLRSGGQLGYYLYERRDIATRMADFLLKYNGFSLSAEYIERNTSDPLTFSQEDELRYVRAGKGKNFQMGYLLPSDLEFVGRFSRLVPIPEIRFLEEEVSEYTIGLNKYLKGHRVKLQSDITLQNLNSFRNGSDNKRQMITRFQIEVGI